MTAAASNTPISVDYTGRDYYAIRNELIKRVQNRVPDWQGTDPNDFGLALVESFAYMGDLVNYYIDRIANETYLLTATQRDSLLNLAAMYGYRPANYVSASTELQITSSQGYAGYIGGAIIEPGTFTATGATGTGSVVTYTCANTFVVGEQVTITGFSNTAFNLTNAAITAVTPTTFQVSAAVSGTASGTGTVTLGNYAKIIVPNDHPFTADSVPATGKYNQVIVNSMPDEADGFVGKRAVKYKSSAFNGTFPVAYVGYDNFGKNTVWYRPMANVTGISIQTATITAAVASGTKITYTAANTFVPGQVVTITGLSTTAFNLVSATIATANSTQFTILSTLTGTAVTGASATATDLGFTLSLSDSNLTMSPVPGQRIHLRNVLVSSGANYNGIWVIDSVTPETSTTPLQVYIRTTYVDPITSFSTDASISSAKVTTISGTDYLMYSAWNGFVTGETVTITGFVDKTATVTAASAGYTASSVTATVTAASAAGGTVTYTANNSFTNGQYVSITGISTTAFNLTNVQIATASSTQFTVTNSATGAGVTGATATATIQLPTVTYTATNSFAAGQTVSVTGLSTTAFNLTNVLVNTATSSQFTVLNSATGGSVTGATASATVAGTLFNLANKVITSRKNVEAIVSRATVTTGVPTYYVSQAFAVGDYVTTRSIASAGNEVAQDDLGYNLTDQTITAVGTVPFTINSVVGASPSSGRITFQTSSTHSFLTNDYVTITGVANLADTTVTSTNVYNLVAAKILAVPTPTSFVVEGYWTQTYDAVNSTSPTATMYSFTIGGANVFGECRSSGSAVSEYFTIAKPSGFSGSWASSTNALATPVVGGTYTSGGEIVYANIPTLVTSGPYVTAVGSTIVPKGTQVSTNVTVEGVTKQIIFSTLSDLSVPFRSSASVLARHGEDVSLRTENAANSVAKPYDIAGELLGFSDGSADQSFALKEVEVATRDVRVFVDTSISWEEWLQVEHVNDYTPSSKVFQVDVLASGEVRATFGDGISGMIPNRDSGIKAVYFAGGGAIGNVSAGSLTTWNSVVGVNSDTIKNSMTVTNTAAAVGGADPESNDSIRYNAPKSLRALNRAVTLEDFSNLALSVDGIVKANAVANSRSSVTIYIAPTSGGETTPGVDDAGIATTAMAQYKGYVADYLASKKQIGTTVTVLEPVYSPIHVELQYSLLPQYNQGLVETAIKQSILDSFSYDNLTFADVITPEEVEFKIRQVDGVANARVVGLYRDGGNGRNSLIGDPYELFVFSGSDIGITATSTNANLIAPVTITAYDSSGTSLGAGTISPTINSGVYSYTLALPYNSAKINIVASTNDALASVSVNDNIATEATVGGTTTYTVSNLKVPDTTLIIVVTAQDGVTVNSYKFKVSVATS
jgi:hypothetical protein